MESEKTFRTKTGYCHVLPEKIVLTRDGVIGNAAKIVSSNTISRPSLLYSAICVYLFFQASKSFREQHVPIGFVYLVTSLFLLYAIVKSLNNSATPVIKRDSIKSVNFKEAKPGLTRAFFEVFFENENGKIKKRLIMLPGSLSGGDAETGKAVEIMRNEGLLQ